MRAIKRTGTKPELALRSALHRQGYRFRKDYRLDLAPGTTARQRAALVSRIVSANPDGTPGGSYELSHARASAIVNTEQMGGQPLALAVGLAVAAMLSLALTLLSLVRRRRHSYR